MKLDPHSLLVRLCHGHHLSALIGDLEELRARRTRTRGPRYAIARFWLDVLSVLLFQSRAWRWTAREWGVAGTLTVIAVMTVGGVELRTPPLGPYSITATDAAGVFVLDMLRGRVVGATVDGRVLLPADIVQSAGRVVLRGAGSPGDLEIDVTERGGIRWEGRQPGWPAGGQETPIELDLARRYFAEIDSVSAADGGRLWGVPLAGPTLFVEPDTRFIVANVADSAGALSPRDGVWVGTLPEGIGIANTAVAWAGRRWTMVTWPVPSQGYARRRLLIHESFHRVQPLIGLPLSDPSNAHLATRNGRILTRLEWRALAEALVRSGQAREHAVADALVFRARRHVLFANAAEEERALELNEGLAEYTGLRLSGLPDVAREVTAASDLLRREGAASFARSAAYATGPAYGLLLDAADPTWRRHLGDTTGLNDLLARAYGQPGASTDSADIASRARWYDGGRVMGEETRAAERAAAEEARLRASLVDGPVLTLPVGSAFHYSFNPNDAVPLPGHGTVYGAAQVRDEWGRLTVESGGVLIRRQDRFVTGVVVSLVPSSPEPPTAGEGWRLELAEGWEVRRGARLGDWIVERQR